MSSKGLALSLGSFIGAEATDCLSDLLEVGIDAVMDEGVLQGIPFISTVVSLTRITWGVAEWHNIKKLAAFLDEIRKHTIDAEKKEAYIAMLSADAKRRDRELTYILVLIDRYLSEGKPRVLAMLYLAFLDGVIDWDEFVAYSEVVDQLLSTDIIAIGKLRGRMKVFPGLKGEDSLLRLQAVGVLYRKDNWGENLERAERRAKRAGESLSNMYDSSAQHEYALTSFGSTLQRIITQEDE